MIGFLQNIGRTSLAFLAAIGRLVLFTSSAIRWTFSPPYYLRQLGRQIIDIGYYSLPVVGLTTLFSGMVLALQSYTGFAAFLLRIQLPLLLCCRSRVSLDRCLLV